MSFDFLVATSVTVQFVRNEKSAQSSKGIETQVRHAIIGCLSFNSFILVFSVWVDLVA